MVLGKLKRRLVLNTSVVRQFVKSVTRSGATLRKSAARTSLSMIAAGISAQDVNLNRTSLVLLNNKIQNNTVAKNGKI